jgi:magnesium chelatase subunit I
MGVNSVEREGVSFTHPAKFTLVGTMNPEEGELRPQLLDRFGLCVNVTGINDPEQRVEVMERRGAFDQDGGAFAKKWQNESADLAEKIIKAKELLPSVVADREILTAIARLCIETGIDGHRGDIITLKTAKTLAAWQGRTQVEFQDVDIAAELALPHRMRRQPFSEMGSTPMGAIREYS